VFRGPSSSSSPPLRIAGAVLAGGAASRLNGRLKGLLERAPGQPILAHLLAELRRAGVGPTVVVANDPVPYRPLGCTVIPDLRPGLGPLGGIEAALAHFAPDHDAVAFLPCDLPGISATEVRRLLDAFRANPSTGVMVVAGARGFHRHPCCCVVPCGLLPAVSRSLDDSKLKIGLLWRDRGVVEVPFPDPEPFCNLNTPEDFAAWLRRHPLP
jgi:molybdopterin-guanine dinucleotide biosynthesis protein A